MPRSYRCDTRSRDGYRLHAMSQEKIHSLWRQRYDLPKFDRYGILAIAAIVGVMFRFILFTNSRDGFHNGHTSGKQYKTHEITASRATGDLLAEPVNASKVQLRIDPNFAYYLHMLAKKEADVLTGRKFLSIGSDADVENEESEGAINSESSGISKSLVEQSDKSSSTSRIVRLPLLVQDGYNITRLSQMLLRVILMQNVYSMVVVPCEKHMSWMGRFLEGTSEQLPKPFLFYCVDSSKRAVKEAEDIVGEIDGVNTNFIERQFWSAPLPRADLFFSWDGFEGLSLSHVHKLLDTVIRQGHHKLCFLGSTPSTKTNSDRTPLNLRRAPFSYTRPMKMYKELYSNESLKGVDKQLYLYEVSKMKNKNKRTH